jgi:predicted metal-binding membrane protein
MEAIERNKRIVASSNVSITAEDSESATRVRGLAREQAFLATSALLFAASVWVTIYECRSMSSGMAMPGGWTMSMAWMRMPGQTWLGAAASFMGMWVVMMLAMMLPSLVPMLLRFRRSVREQGGAHLHLGELTTIAAAGYFCVWIILGAVVYPIGVSLSAAEMRWPVFMRVVPGETGVVVLLAGVIQLTSWKARQLRRCRDASVCDPRTPAAGTAWHHGLRLGADCALCCAAFMTVLLVTNVMNLTTMAVVTAAITVERVAHTPERVARVFGVAMVAFGLLTIAR